MGVTWRTVSRTACAVALAAFAVTAASAYDLYSTSRTNGNCASCHGDFRASSYTSKVDGMVWPGSLHDVHRNTMLSGECNACHGSSRYPVDLGSALGGSGLAGYSCSGCHGRSQDGTGTGTTGFGAGLRQRHYRGGVTVCTTCHADANPANKTPAPEKTKPPFYANPGTGHPSIPTDPCNPGPAFNENFAGTTLGLDNDGNGLFDANDPSCIVATATPGESGRAVPLKVTAYNRASGALTISYGSACSATNNTVEYGPLVGVRTYTYSGQVCSIGTAGTATFTLPAGSLYFLVVGNATTVEGSYGTNSAGVERPEDVGVACPIPQNLVGRCD
jgi:hypothetical protein